MKLINEILAETMEPVLIVENVSMFYKLGSNKLLEVLKDINFEAKKGEFISIIGPSGCGKSTLLNIVAGLIRPTGGRVLFNGKEIVGPQRGKIGYVFQDPLLLPWRNVLSNVMLPMELLNFDKKERRCRAEWMLDLVGLKEFAHFYPSELSGGMKQRVALARALAPSPELLLMDEPFGALDEQTRIKLGLELLKLQQQLNITILFVTHSLVEAAMLSDKIIVLSSRPAKVKGIIEVDLEKHIRDPEKDEIQLIRRQLWRLLKE